MRAEGMVDFALVKSKLAADRPGEALDLLRNSLQPSDPFVLQARAARIMRSAKLPSLRPLKIALVASSTVDHLADVLRLWLAFAGFDAEIYIAPFDMVVQTVLDVDSALYRFAPDVVWLYTNHRDVPLDLAPGAPEAVVNEAVAAAIDQAAQLWRAVFKRRQCVILQNNADIPCDDAFGNLAGVARWGRRNALRLYNIELGAAAQDVPGVVVADIDHVSAQFGKMRWCDDRFWFHSKHACALDAAGMIASLGARLIAASKGLSKKCLVLDLDNTLWGGVVGDDGLDGIVLGQKAEGEAYVAFQSYLLELKERGILLAVCSKNDDATAREVFERHPDMRLRLADIAAFQANWNNKVENIGAIAATLNIGVDSLVFFDDNPAERAIVRQFLPDVAVPEFEADPAGYVRALAAHGYFETVAFSPEDRERARYYAENARRSELRLNFADTASYLQSLEMEAEVGRLDAFHLPRVAQLINKSNQFHLTTTRYSEAALQDLMARPDCGIRYFKLRDRFGDNGLISAVVLRCEGERLVIDTWVMSCRVLARTMEEFVCNEIFRIARERGCRLVLGRYKPTPKNKLVAELYRKLNFDLLSDDGGTTIWQRDVGAAPREWETQIKRIAP